MPKRSNDILSAIEEVTKLRSKEIVQGQKLMRKFTSSTNQEVEKLHTGGKDLEKIEQGYLGEDGIEKVRKKGKIFFQAVKALGELSRDCISATEDFSPFEKETAEYDELKEYTSSISLILSRINKNKRQHEAVMGLEFSLKRRSINGPIGKINNNLKKIRELLNNEFSYVKVLEELNQALIECQELENVHQAKKEQIKSQKEELKVKMQHLSELEQKIQILEKKPEIIHFRKLKREIKDYEYSIGKRINFLRKPFRKLVNIAERGEIQVPFGLVGLARKYESNAVVTFLENEQEGYPGLQALVETLIRFNKQLKLKKSRLNKLEQDAKNIKDGKLDEWKKKRAIKLDELKETEKSEETITIWNQLEEINNKAEIITEEINELEETIKIEERNLEEVNRQIDQKWERSEGFLSQARE